MNDNSNVLDNVYDVKDDLRLPGWRRERAQQIVEGAETVPGDDNWILRCARYVKQREYVQTTFTPGTASMHRAARKLAADFNDIHYSLRLFEDGPGTRWFVEAGLMDRKLELDGIAAELGMNVGVLRAYEALFFDVRNRLKSPIFVHGRLLGPMAVSGTGRFDCDLLWKAYSYYKGIAALFKVVTMGHIDEAEYLEICSLVKAEISKQAWRGVAARRLNDVTTHEAVQEHTALQEGAKPEKDDTVVASEGLGRMLKCIAPTLIPSVGEVPRQLSGKAEERAGDHIRKLAAGDGKGIP